MTLRKDFVHFGRPNRIVLRQYGSLGAATRDPAAAATASVSTQCFPNKLSEFAGSTCYAPGSYRVRTRLLSRCIEKCEPVKLIHARQLRASANGSSARLPMSP